MEKQKSIQTVNTEEEREKKKYHAKHGIAHTTTTHSPT